ncbi:MAG TPA: c-type cytochrome [Pseudomonadales bacterium]|jgi:cytochrome c5
MNFLLIGLALSGVALVAHAVPPGSEDEIRARTAPMGALCRAGENCSGFGAPAAMSAPAVAGAQAPAGAPAAAAQSGEQIYNQFCVACHAVGVANAPKLGDVAAWADRIAKGMDVLMASTLNGINAMPAKGTCMTCTDADLQAAVDYMVDGSR